MKQTTLLADPRMLHKARVKGAPGARIPAARGPRNAVQKAAEESRQLAIQRKQAIAVASKPPTKIGVAPKGLLEALRRNDQIIKAPAKKLGQKRALEGPHDKRHDVAERRGTIPPAAQCIGNDKSADAIKFTASNASTKATAVQTALPITPKKPAPARAGGMLASSRPLSMKGMPPVETKRIFRNSNGTITTSVSIDWNLPHNKQILGSYSATEQAAALAKPATTTTIPAAEHRKRGSCAISSDDSASPSACANASSSATSLSADEDTVRLVAPPYKRRKMPPSLFMPHKAVAKPRTQD